MEVLMPILCEILQKIQRAGLGWRGGDVCKT